MGTKPATDDPFDIEALEAVAELGAIQKGSGAPSAKRKRVPRQQAERYIQMTETGARGFEVLGCSRALVWFEILYRVWKSGKTTIELPNKTLAGMGVSRWAKYRVINRLERAGWIQVARPRFKTMQITLLKPECVVFQRKWAG